MACPNCGRTFLPDRLEVHLRSCKTAKKKPEDQNETSMNTNASSNSIFSTPSKTSLKAGGDTSEC